MDRYSDKWKCKDQSWKEVTGEETPAERARRVRERRKRHEK